jgi:hypothetical protein
MHVVMAIEAFRFFPIDPTELVDLRAYHVLKRAGQPRLKYRASKAMTTQVISELSLTFSEPRWATRCRKWCRKIDVQPGINIPFLGDVRCPFGVLHENHGAYRRDSGLKKAFSGSVRGLDVPSPIIGVYNEQTGLSPSLDRARLVCARDSLAQP